MNNIKAQKKYGQNFLNDKNILNKISNLASVTEDDLIIEIGPGTGALTSFLYQKKCYLLCYEIDLRMKSFLEQYSNKTKVIYTDFLKSDIILDIKDIPFKNIYVVANIPYYITSPIIKKLLELEIDLKKIILLVQKEFAERITASYNTKQYNALTLYINYKYDASYAFDVNRKCFDPVPNVDSAVITLTKKENISVINKEFYFKFIKDAFQSKRKTLKNNLKAYNWAKISSLLKEMGYQENVRAEEIKMDDFVFLCNNYEK